MLKKVEFINNRKFWILGNILGGSQMVNTSKTYNLKRVNKVNVIIVWIIALILSSQHFLSVSVDKGIDTSFKTVGVAVLALIIYFLPIRSYIKGMLISFIPTLACFLVTYIEGTTWTINFIYFVAIAMVTLYFKKELLLIYAGLLNTGLVILYILTPENLLITGTKLEDLISVLIIMNGVILVLYFLTKWGKDLIKNSSESENRVTKLLESLEKTLTEIQQSSEVLDENITNFQLNLKSAEESSESITFAMQEMAKGVSEEANSIGSITYQMTNAAESIARTSEISYKIQNISSQVDNNVSQGIEKVNEMNSQMGTVQEAVGVALSTVKELHGNIENINRFLTGIVEIAEQTNLLALNAAIEAARAGEHGKGFGVVAEEIRKLAEQSASTVEDINKITNSINQKTEIAVKKVEEGNQAVETGNSIMKDVSSQFDVIKQSFESTLNYINEENDLIEKVTNMFNEIHEQLENIASISEQHAASTEEVLATVETQEQNMVTMSNSLDEINNLSKNLRNIAEA